MIRRFVGVCCAASLALSGAHAQSEEPAGAPTVTDAQGFALKCDLDDAGINNATTLFMASSICGTIGKDEASAYLLHLGQIRGITDMVLLKPAGDEDLEQATGLYNDLYNIYGGIGPIEVYAEKESRERLFQRIKDWTPVDVSAYDPGWKYKSVPTNTDYLKTINETRTARLKQIEEAAILLENKEYRAALDELKQIQEKHPQGVPTNSDDWKRAQELIALMQKIAGA
jgi:hypothetical protein